MVILAIPLIAMSLLFAVRPAAAQEGDTPWQRDWAAGETETVIVMIFISGPGLPSNGTPEFGRLVHRSKRRLAAAAAESGLRFKAVGVSMEAGIEESIRYLLEGETVGYANYPDQDFGPWDEIHVGGAWLNELVSRWIWRSEPGDSEYPLSAVPQILLVRRVVTRRQTGITVGDTRLLRRIFGPEGLREWLAEGAPLTRKEPPLD